MIFFEALALSLLGGAVALDRASLFQVMVSRPIVAAPFIGLLLGDAMTGFKVGLVIELIWIGCLPVGASVPPDETIVSILVTVISIWCADSFAGNIYEIIPLSLLFLAPSSAVARRVDSYVRNINTHSAHAADAAAERLDLMSLERACVSGIRNFYAGYVLVIFALLLAGYLAVSLTYTLLPAFFLSALEKVYYILPVIGVASLFSAVRLKNSYALVFVSFVLCWGLLEGLNL